MGFLMIAWCLVAFGFGFSTKAQTDTPMLQLVVIPFQVDNGGQSESIRTLERALKEGLQASGVELLPESWVSSVMNSRQGELNFNPHCEEAQALGAALGCDFYVLGRVLVTERSASDRTCYHEVQVNVFWVNTRTGSLVKWERLSAKGATGDQAQKEAIRLLREHGISMIALLQDARQKQQSPASSSKEKDGDLLDLRSGSVPENVKLPTFIKHPRPDSTEFAKEARIEARIEAEIVLDKTGTVTEIQIVRWAGYDLEEAVKKAVRSYTFKPATCDGVPVSVRILAEYNFRRVEQEL